MNPSEDLQELLTRNVSSQAPADQLEHAGALIDASADLHSVAALDAAFALLKDLSNGSLPPDIGSLFHYFQANAWDCKRLFSGRDWKEWEQPEHQAQILELRRSVAHESFCNLVVIRRCQVLTNLANQLSHCGRFIDAIETWDRALAANPQFAMACGNRGRALHYYAAAVYDAGHAQCLAAAAQEGLSRAAADDAFYETLGYEPARTGFDKEAKEIASRIDVAAIREHMTAPHTLGRGQPERSYRSWCLKNRLFLNPLNDLGVLSIAAHDVLTLPTIRHSSPDFQPPPIIGFFNQMKQEYVSARYFYFESISKGGVHFSDRGVLQYNTLDYPAYSLSCEQMRASFRIAYSVLDKIAFFINEYFALRHKPKSVSFRSVWYEKCDPARGVHQRFASSDNWPLRGLFWLAKDFFEEDFRSVMEPDAAALNEIRNHLEHKYLQLHIEAIALTRGSRGIAGDLAYRLTTDDFSVKSLRLLKLVRAALIYLSLAVHAEERKVNEEADPRSIHLMLPLDPWSDEWKRGTREW